MAHYEGTGPEILRDCPEITHFVAGLGTSGTLMGTGRSSRNRTPTSRSSPSSRRWASGWRGCATSTRATSRRCSSSWHGFDLLDRKRVVRPRESLEWTRRLVSECGVFAGISSGAALAGAAKVASEIDEGVIVFIVCDGGWKYLSTGAYTDDLDAAEAKAETIIYF